MEKIMEIADKFIFVGKKYDKLPLTVVERNLISVGNIVFSIAIIVLIVTGLILGVKFAIVGVDERAKMKEKMVWYVISAVLVFSATGIYNVIVGVVTATLSA